MRHRVAELAPEASETTIPVKLGERSYDIVIGRMLLDGAGARIAATLPGARCAIVSDETVAALYLDRLKASLGKLYLGEAVVVPGEHSKSFPVLAELCERLLTLGVERGDVVVALGGGVVGDLAGFAASILRRGVRFVQIPTTLLAQVDSSVGGKTGIDTPQGKNLIGAFHQPSLVLADISVLETLSQRDFRSGYAEVMKYGLLGDAPFFAWLEAHWPKVFSGKGEARASAIATSCRAKTAIVEADEREESGLRPLPPSVHSLHHHDRWSLALVEHLSCGAFFLTSACTRSAPAFSLVRTSSGMPHARDREVAVRLPCRRSGDRRPKVSWRAPGR